MTHRIARFILKSLALIASLILVLAGTVQLGKRIHRFMLPPAERILAEADALADRSNWRAAKPLYKRAEVMFHQQGNAALELYAKVSQIPAHTESSITPMSEWLAEVEQALSGPAAHDPKLAFEYSKSRARLKTTTTPHSLTRLGARWNKWPRNSTIGLSKIGRTARRR